MTVPIIDTHKHLIYPDKWKYSWAGGISQLEGRAFRDEDYLQEIKGTSICQSIFMETSPDEWREEVADIYDIAARPNSETVGLIANCRPEQNGFEEYLDSIQKDKLVGLRRICHVEPDELSQQQRFVDNVRLIAGRELTFDLCFLARQLPLALELAQKCPNVQFILDHCGVPNISGGALDPWRDHMRQLAALPNVACKISGVLAYCKPDNATIEAVRPFVEHSIECFGFDRVVWGSDWPVCNVTSTLQEWVLISREIVSAISEADKHKLFHENATHIYGLM